MTAKPWYEVDLRKEDPGARRLAEAFFRDFCAVHEAQGLPVNMIHVLETETADRYLLPPAAAAAYFMSPLRSALADWLRSTGIAKARTDVPDVTGYAVLPCPPKESPP
jgi:hypothetical protein